MRAVVCKEEVQGRFKIITFQSNYFESPPVQSWAGGAVGAHRMLWLRIPSSVSCPGRGTAVAGRCCGVPPVLGNGNVPMRNGELGKQHK